MSIEELFKNGYTILDNYINHETCDKLKDYLDNKFKKNKDSLSYNYHKGHYQIHLPNNLNNLPQDILFDKKIHLLLKEVLGNYYMYSYTCNANIAEKNQPYHMDCSHFHPIHTIKKFGSPGPPGQIIVNIYLQDTNEENGSFEIVPGSHLFTDFDINEDGIIDEKYIKNTVKCNLNKGSVIIRDKRTWHRGTLNKSKNVRYMVGLGYSVNWYKLNNLTFDNDCEDLFYDAPFSTWNIKFN